MSARPMQLYGVQCWWDCEEHGVAAQQQMFRASGEESASRSFHRRAARIRAGVRRNGPSLTGDIQLFRLNEAGDKGVLLRSIAA